MSFRASLKNLIRRSPATALHERSAELHGSLAGQTRRTAAAAPLLPLASGPAVSPEEAAFLDLMPQALPVLRQYIVADAAWRAIADAAEEIAGPFPGHDCTAEQHIAWQERVEAERDARGYAAARDACEPIETALDALVDGYDRVPMRTLPAILFKAALDPLHDGWIDDAADDLRRLAAERFDLPQGRGAETTVSGAETGTSAVPEAAPAQSAPLAQACDQAAIDWNGIPSRSEAENWEDEQLDVALDDYNAVFLRAINEPSRSMADVQAKARLVLHDIMAHTIGDAAEDEAKLTVDRRLTRVVLREIANLSSSTALTPPADPTDWHSPPPGFMAYPADDPQCFVIVREGLRLELERLHRIALAEYARKVGPDATEAKRNRVRRELRLAVFESASPNGDAEILVLGMDLDAVHARWRAAAPAYWAAQKHVDQAGERAKAHGGSVTRASEAAWSAPGVGEAGDLFENICGELERISKAIWRTPARTPLGLAVKARATLVMVFLSGQYERDSHLGEDEDLTEQATRALIEACCALAGVDWKGQPIGEDEASTPTPQSEFEADCAWAKAQAAAVDLSGLSMLQLANLFENFVKAADDWLNLDGEPWLEESSKSSFRVPNAAGRLIDREQNRAAWIRDRIAKEMQEQTPLTDTERNRRLEALIRYELLCEGGLHNAPELRAEIAKAWGG